MGREALGLLLVATSVYAFLALMTLLSTRVIDYSPFDLVLGVTLGLLLIVLIAVFIAGFAPVVLEASARKYRPWL